MNRANCYFNNVLQAKIVKETIFDIDSVKNLYVKNMYLRLKYLGLFKKKLQSGVGMYVLHLVILHLPAYEDGTECSETSAYKIQTPGNYPEENIQHTEHGESLKSWV